MTEATIEESAKPILIFLDEKGYQESAKALRRVLEACSLDNENRVVSTSSRGQRAVGCQFTFG
jgi:hypothetical protein